jgi:nicotinamidase/pyrazinamidase
MDIRWKIHGVPGSAGFRLIDGLPAVKDYDFFVWKGIELDMHPYSACYHDLSGKKSTGVIEWLRANGVTAVIVGGLAWEFCVLKTVTDLKKAGFEVILNAAATRGISEEGVIKATEEMLSMGVHIVQKASELSSIIN